MTELYDASRAFTNFNIPEWLAGNVEVGRIAGVPIYADEVRRLKIALQDAVKADADAPIIELLREKKYVHAIKLRREQTLHTLKDAKDYVNQLGVDHGLRVYYDDGTYKTGYYFVGEEPCRYYRPLGIGGNRA